MYPLKLYLRKLPVAIMVAVGVVLNLFSWIWLLLQIPMDLEQVFLHYNILFGVDQIGQPRDMYITPLIGLAILGINVLLGWLLYRKDWFFSYIMLLLTIVVNVAVAVMSILVVFLNI